MERERLSRLVKDPEQVSREDIADLNDLATRFPWFAGAQLLRTIGEHRAGDVLSDEVVHLSASHVPSRTVLFDHIEKAPVLTVVAKEPLVQATVELIQEPLPEAPAPPEVEVEIPEVSPHFYHEESTPVAPIIVPDVVVSAPPVEVISEKGAIDPPVEVPDTEEADPLDMLIRQAVKIGGYDITAPALEPEAPPTPIVGEAEKILQTPRSGKRTFTDWLSESPVPTHKPVPEDRSGIPSISADWIRALAKDKEAVAPPASPSPLSTTQDIVGFEATVEDPAGQLLEEPTGPPRKRPLEPADTVDLIDRFISQQDPPQPKTAFYTPQQAAKRSLDDSAGLVTETLAKVYVKQGNLPKAIEAYHKLALKFPEKSAFFAALAKELEVQQHK